MRKNRKKNKLYFSIGYGQELTYKELYDSIDNMWSILLTTGYLTQKGKPEGRIILDSSPVKRNVSQAGLHYLQLGFLNFTNMSLAFSVIIYTNKKQITLIFL